MQLNSIRLTLYVFVFYSLSVGCQPNISEDSLVMGHKTDTKLVAQEIRGVYLPDTKVAKAQISPSCPNNICAGLGNIFYLPNINALSINTGGSIFFKNRKLGSCTQLSKTTQISRDLSSTSSMENFIKNTMATADLSGSYKTGVLTVKGSAQFMTGSSSDITTSFNSTTLDINIVTHSVDFLQNTECFSKNNIDQALLTEFEALALIDPSQVGSVSSWSPYVEFLKTQGSHIMMQQQIGSRFQQWESSTSNSKDIQNTLKAKACAEVEGLSEDGGWSTESCGAYSKDEKQKALKSTSTSKTIILGGTIKTRTGLGKKVTEENLNAFIDSAEQGDQAVRFIFKPIWQLFSKIYTPACAAAGSGSKECQNLQRTYNLQASYEGWTAVGCPLLQDGRKKTYQTMAIAGSTSQGINTYECIASKTGCRKKEDCQAGAFLGSACYCYGPGCIDSGAKISGTNMTRNKIRGSKKGGLNKGLNNSCYYKLGAPCKCDTSWSGGLLNRTLYQQSAP